MTYSKKMHQDIEQKLCPRSTSLIVHVILKYSFNKCLLGNYYEKETWTLQDMNKKLPNISSFNNS